MKINSKFVNDKVLAVARRVIAKHAKEGWVISPDARRVRAIVKGLIRTGGECPCVNTSADRQCPCTNYRKDNYCCCGLYEKTNPKDNDRSNKNR